MYTRELLLAAGILLLVFLGRREHLAFTDSIKDIRNRQDDAEFTRIFELAPASLQQSATAANTVSPVPGGAKALVAGLVQVFQQRVYVPATEPITETVIDNFIRSYRTELQAIPLQSGEPDVYVQALSNGDAKRLLMSYFGITAAGSIPAIANLPTSSTTADINTVLGQMRDTLLEYKMTGKSEYKTAYDGTKAWLDQYIASLTTQLTRESDAITTDVDSYRSANTDMLQTQADFQKVKTQGPALENQYLTIKKQMDNVPAPDTTSLYVKGGIAAGLALGIVALSAF
jgi:hypothetical protein